MPACDHATMHLTATGSLHEQLPRSVVPRPELERYLDGVAAGGLALVVASAGSGKSVLLKQWSSSRPNLRVAALALTARHDDAVVLARDLVSAVRAVAAEVDPAIGELLTTSGAALGDPFVDGLREGLTAIAEGLVLVLEDVHVLSNRAVVDDLGRLLTSLPGTTRAVATTRRDLPWPTHRLRLADKVVEIRSADLAFRDGEARMLLEGVSRRHISDELVTRLVNRTEGWAVGLQLAAISLRTAPDAAAFVESFTGSDHLVAEYLLNEVVENQDPAVRRFLLQTSVLNWLSAEMCDAVTGTGNASAMLDELYRRSMFLIPLDASGTTFRYHHLFGEVLRYRLRVEAPGAAEDLHHRAARWLLLHGHEEEAVEHLLQADDSREAFRVISTLGHRLFERGEAATLVRWLSAVGAGDPDGPAVVEINLLAAQLGADEAAAATETYRRIVRRTDLTLGERTTANALYTTLVFRGLAPETVLEVTEAVRGALRQLGPGDLVDFLGIGGEDSTRLVCEHDGAVAQFLVGDLDGAATTLEWVRTLPGMRYPLWHVFVLGSLALVRAWQGHCTEASGLGGSAIDAARSFGVPHHHASTFAHLALALVRLDRVEPESAQRSLAEARLQMRARPASVVFADLHAALEARLATVREGSVEGLAQLRRPAPSGAQAPLLRAARRSLRVQLLIGAGNLAGARAVLEETPDREVPAHARIDLALAVGDVDTARVALDAWHPSPDDLRSHVRRLVRGFAVLEAEGEHRAAEASLTDAVAAASAERLRWPFLEVPAAVRAVRRGVGGRASWLAGDALWDLANRLEPRLRAQESLVEPLTARELAVLAYLPGRLKNYEIAADMFVSVNTVKTHLGSIYRKLGVTERNEAITRATELGLL